MKDNTLKLYPGQNYMFKLVVQNKDEEDITVRITLESSIATLVGGPELEVPGKTYNRHVFFNITIPEDAQIGDEYNINYLVAPVEKGEGQVPLAVRYDRNFKVSVIPKPEGVEEKEAEPTPEKPEITGEVTKPLEKIPSWISIPILVIIIFVLVVLIGKKSQQMAGKITKKPDTKITKPERVVSKPEPETKTEPVRPPEHPKQEEQRPIEPAQPAEPRETEEPRQTLEKQERVLSPHQYFHLNDGRKLKDLEDLYYAIQTMSEDTFNHHVSSSKNDFATWMAHSLQQQELANKLFTRTTKQEMLELIKNELEKQ
ncbi:hypothetical protein AYK26_06325 [Euryarchaeota archaeon SM23-78]|nr:MAG: hypothetical protein AYK26_06325 [Euryarchaeota archaeon SM23-78]